MKLTFVYCICYWVMVTGLNTIEREIVNKGHAICSAYGHKLVTGIFGKKSHLLCLKLKAIGSSPLMSHQSALFLDPEPEEDNAIGSLPLSLSDVMMAYGFPVEDPAAGSAEGYIGDDHQFYGVLHLGNRTLHADPYGQDDHNKVFGFFNNDQITRPRKRRHIAQANFLEQLPYFPYQIEERNRTTGVARARICDLLLLADKAFYDMDANASLNLAVRRMIHSVAQADIIFRNADFNEDGVPDNIGFSVKYIIVLSSNDTNTRVFGDLLRRRTIDGREYLMRFSRLRRLAEVCLGVAFSGHAFHNRTLGLSFTSLGGGIGGTAGGLCDRRAYGHAFNTLAVAHATSNEGERLPERIAALTLAHEIGHSFGAHHDDNFPNIECGGFLMGAQSTATENGLTFEFSVCSKRLIAATISSMGYCLAEEDRPYCGNGIVEEGEACDCGLPSRCNHRDPCCTPRAGGALIFEEGALHKEGCSVAPTAACHPSQGPCCTPQCQLANLLDSGIDCSGQQKECTCTESHCRCGLGGRCVSDGSCHAAECVLLGLRECECPTHGTGGTLARVNMCGVCCHLKNNTCVGAELAATETLIKNLSLPYDWPDEDYKGPNVTVQLCSVEACRTVQIRAWSAGDNCVSRNAIGICSGRQCKRHYAAARSNIYPDVIRMKLLKVYPSYATNINAAGLTKLCIFMLMILQLVNDCKMYISYLYIISYKFVIVLLNFV
ncbi:hypothetical protein ACJJTC_015875 [Scirpophaga incertulas]